MQRYYPEQPQLSPVRSQFGTPTTQNAEKHGISTPTHAPPGLLLECNHLAKNKSPLTAVLVNQFDSATVLYCKFANRFESGGTIFSKSLIP